MTLKLTINPKELNRLKRHLAERLEQGVADAAIHAAELAPVDTGRLQSTVRASKAEIHGNAVRCSLIAGGLSVKGVFREQTFNRDVDYGLATEIRHAWLRQNLVPLQTLIVEGLKR